MQSLRQAINEFRASKRAMGHFNISDSNQLRAIAMASRDAKLPAIVGLSEGEREFFPLRHAKKLIEEYRAQGIDLYLNADHTYTLEKAKEAIDAGVDSIVVDGAKLSLPENIALTTAVVRYARSKKGLFSGRDIVVEGELGYIGTSSALHDSLPQGVAPESMTTPDEAQAFVRAADIDCLAPAVGNVHGMLRGGGEPHLSAQRVAEIAAVAKVPLVLHGASGNTQEDVAAAIEAGVAIVHINTELRVSYRDALRVSLSGEETTPYKFLTPAVEAMRAYVEARLRAFARVG